MGRHCGLRIADCGMLVVASWALAGATDASVTSFDDIQFWVGAGTNRAGFVVDWDGNGEADGSLAWGYRWNGDAHGEDMLRAAVAADPRLFAKLGENVPYGVAVRGVGYDLNDDGQFALDDGTEFDAEGVAPSGPTDGAMALDAGDSYREGWQIGVWNYGVANANPWQGDAWIYSPLGATDRVLVDGAWDSWAFTPTFRPTAFAANVAPATQPADFDSSGNVDGTDFLIWQRGVGRVDGVVRGVGDATGDGFVDAGDLQAWQTQFHGGAAASASSAVPESVSLTTCASALFVVFRRFLQPRRKVS